NRAALLATLGTALEAAEQKERSAAQVSLFGEGDLAESVRFELASVAPWEPREKLMHEKSALGFYFSDHLFSAFRDELQRIVTAPLSGLQPSRDLQWFAGILTGVRVQLTRRGRMAFVVLDDGTAQVEVSVFN